MQPNYFGMILHNPYNHLPGYNCFGCSDKNPIGLKLEFEKNDDTVSAQWTPTHDYQGWNNVLHGGIIATLLDEISFWALQTFLETSGVTSELNVKYLKPVHIDSGTITVTAKIKEKVAEHQYAFDAKLFDGRGILCAEGNVVYFVYPQAIAKTKFHYPGKEAFGL